MKQCPNCKRVYYDDSLNFCLVDGERLEGETSHDAPTVISVPQAPHSNEHTLLLKERVSGSMEPPSTTDIAKDRVWFASKSRWVWLAAILFVAVPAGLFTYRYRSQRSTSRAIDSIAVLPFENASGDANGEYISDGITESLIDSLSQIPNVKVISPASVFRYKGSQTDIAKIAKELGVMSVMTGRIFLKDNKLDISVNLSDVSNNSQLWGQRFTRDAKDIFAVQDEIARQVTESLRVKLTDTQQDKVIKQSTTNPDAYRLYMQGRYLFNDFSEENLTKAIQYFDQAIAADPHYGLAYAARSDCYLQSGDLDLPMAEAISKARHDSSAALAIDPEIAEARTVQAEIKFQFDWDFAESEKDFKTAIASNPNYAESHHQYAWFLAIVGREDESLAEMKLAQQLDPVNPSISIDSCVPYSFKRDWSSCRDQARATIEMFPDLYIAHMTLGTSLFNLGDQAAGLEELQKAETREHTPHLIGVVGYFLARAGRDDEAHKKLAELEDMSKHRYVASYWKAAIHVGLGENDEAFAELEKAYQERSWWLMFLKMEPMMDGLRADPRYTEMLRRIGFPN